MDYLIIEIHLIICELFEKIFSTLFSVSLLTFSLLLPLVYSASSYVQLVKYTSVIVKNILHGKSLSNKEQNKARK